ncbi:MAG: hypothetical protein ACW967_00235 [Candidatus Hodarchaeales archaeon]|jgi:hypothetical protein
MAFSMLPYSSNPFFKNRVNSPFENIQVNIDDIHKEIFDRLKINISQVFESGSSYLEILIAESGLGKSHLLWRIQKYSLQTNYNFLFIDLKPPKYSDSFFVHIFHEFINSLIIKQPNSIISPLELIITEFIIQNLEFNEDQKPEFYETLLTQSQNLQIILQDETIINNVLEFVESHDYKNNIVLDPHFFQLLIQFFNPKFKKTIINYFLGGMITTEDMLQLKLSKQNLDENSAKKWFYDLIRMTKKVFFIGIDSLDLIYQQLKFKGLRKFLDILIDILQNKNIYILLTSSADEWENYRLVIPSYQKDLMNSIINLNPVQNILITNLIREKLILGSENPETVNIDEIWQIFGEDLLEFISERGFNNPKKTLNLMQEAFDYGKKHNWKKKFGKEWVQEKFGFTLLKEPKKEKIIQEIDSDSVPAVIEPISKPKGDLIAERIEDFLTERNFNPYKETVAEFIQWLDKTGRQFPINEEPLLQAIFTKIKIEKHEIAQFGLKLLQFKNRLEKVDVVEVAQAIIKNYDPYRREWKSFDHLPQNLKAIARRYYVIDFLVESLLTLNFKEESIADTWHDIIYRTMNEYLTLTETIRRLGIYYWKKFFETRFIKDVPPLLNYYRDLFLNELEKLIQSPKNEENSTELLILANNLMEIWNIFWRYNQISNDPLLLAMDWISETLYRIIVPAIEDKIFFTTSLSPDKLDTFISQPIESSDNFSKEEKENIARFKSDFSYSIATKYSKIANSQLQGSEIVQGLTSSSWCLYYLLIASKENNDYLFHTKEFWNEFYDGVLLLGKFEEFIVFHYSFLIKCIKTKNPWIQALDILFESLSLFHYYPVDELTKNEQKDLQTLKLTLIGISGFINYPKDILQLFQPMIDPISQNAIKKMPELVRDVFSLAVNRFNDLSNQGKIFDSDKQDKIRVIDQISDQIGLLVAPRFVDEKIHETFKQIGLVLEFSSEVQKGNELKAYDRLFKGWINDIGFEIQIALQTFDEKHSLINWQIGWTKLPDQLKIDTFIDWMKIFIESTLRSCFREHYLPEKGQLVEQLCVNCKEKFRNQPRSNPYITICPKCRYVNMPTDVKNT